MRHFGSTSEQEDYIMNKLITKAAIVAIAMSGLSTAALAQHSSSSDTYANLTNYGGFGPNATFTNDTATNPGGYSQAQATSYYNANALALGSVYHQGSTSPDNTEAATAHLRDTFTLKGHVSRDCSFYGGGTTDHTIDLGTIGIRTGNNDNVSVAFNQNGDITANVNSATAGCNTNNTVTVSKRNGTKGMVNNSTDGYDTDQFTNHIPYSIAVSYTGVGPGATHHGQTRGFTVGLHQDSKSKDNGAWRSQFNMDITAPAQSKGLIAGNYRDTIVVQLAAI